jgi:hypothetical protein
VYRELDPGTRYVKERILETDEPNPDKIFNVMLYRLIGREETHSSIGFQHLSNFDPQDLQRKLKHIRDVDKKPPFTGAYTVCAYRGMGSSDKIENVCLILSSLHRNFGSLYKRLMRCGSCKSVYLCLRGAGGFGNFLAYQVLVDLLYPLRVNGGRSLLSFSPEDWAVAGPGAKRGISMIVRTGLRVDELTTMRWLRDNQDREFKRLRIVFDYLTNDEGATVRISLSNIQNCLCEFHKYIKIGNHTGRARRRFVPTIRPESTQILLAPEARVLA